MDVRRWRLAVTGAVAAPLSLSYDELLGLGLVEFGAAINRLGTGSANTCWLGVPLRRVLAAAGPDKSGPVLVTRAVDGWEASMPMRTLDEVDGLRRRGDGGAGSRRGTRLPARVFVPGVCGQYTGAKWLAGLRVQAAPPGLLAAPGLATRPRCG